MAVTPVGHEASERAQAGIRRFRANQETLERAWPDLLERPLYEWVAVYDDGMIVTAPNMREIRDAVPESKRDTAVMRFIKQSDEALIL